MSGAFTRQTAACAAAERLVRAYYAASLLLVLAHLPRWAAWKAVPELDALWPLAWIVKTGPVAGAWLVLALALGGTLAAALNPASRLRRLLHLAGLLEFAALASSFGKINHAWHAWLGVAFFLLFLPAPAAAPAAARAAPGRAAGRLDRAGISAYDLRAGRSLEAGGGGQAVGCGTAAPV